ncbi:MAG: hypothetical protein ACI4SV_02990, partial [Duodenibacillus sp.]
MDSGHQSDRTISRGTKDGYGARPLKRAVQELLENPV